jgi:HTH-type transcriptional regulator, transcriptional repressor of NAD biosynthesis genes
MRKYHRAFIVGKFAPFHLGHKYLIDTALEQSDHVLVLGYSNPDLGVTTEQKYKAFEQVYGTSFRIMWAFLDQMSSPSNDDEEEVHRMFCHMFLRDHNYRPDVVFSSEQYGKPFTDRLSDLMGMPIDHVCVDLDREKYPVSATKIRSGEMPADQWSLIK